MQCSISRSILAAIVAEARACRGIEVCGLLFGTAEAVTAVQPAKNVADDPAQAFEIDPRALLAAHRAARRGGPRIVGHYHSHPLGPARPSARDAAAAFEVGQLWLIVAREGVRAWRTIAPGTFAEVTLDIG